MAAALYLEHYLESLESLPVELQRNFTLMRDLDSRAQGIMREIDAISDSFLRNAKGTTREKKKELDQKLQRLFGKAKEYADDKVQLAIQTYELVDKHIRRLDSDLARFESEIKNGTVNIGPAGQVAALMSPRLASANILAAAEAAEAAEKATKKGRKREKEPTTTNPKKSKAAALKSEPEEKVPKTGKGGQAAGKGGKSPGVARKKQKTEMQLVAEQVAAAAAGSGEVLDMPVDPNEPTYCICHQVSFGQMIACDNPDCTIEWFHIGCMGLSSIPKGKWYCPKCQPLRKK